MAAVRTRHAGSVATRATHSSLGFDPAVGGLPFGVARDGEQSTTPDIAPGAIDGAVHIQPGTVSDRLLFADTIMPPEVVTSLPALPDDSYPVGVLVFLTTDAKLYRNTDGSTWSTAISSGDITGHVGIPIAAAAPALPDATYPAGSYYWNSVSLSLFKTVDGTTWIKAIEATDIVANTITAGQIAAGTITATEIAALTITGAKIAAGTIDASKIVADSITAGQIAAGAIGTTELSASAVIANVLNVGGTVEIDSTGITITDGALTLLDQFGASVLTGAGFGASWLAYIESGGVYNGDFAAGTTNNITATTLVGTASTEADYLASLSADVPYWVVSVESGAGSLQRFADSNAIGGYALRWSGTENGEIFQDIPVTPGQWAHPVLSWRYTNSSSEFELEVTWQFRAADHSAIGGEFSTGLNFTDTKATYFSFTAQAGGSDTVPTNARYARLSIRFNRISGSPTVYLNSVSMDGRGRHLSHLYLGDENNYAALILRNASSNIVMYSYEGTDVTEQWFMFSNGTMRWGGDADIARIGVGNLEMSSGSDAQWGVVGGSGSRASVQLKTDADNTHRLALYGDATLAGLELGPGNAGRDIKMYRSAAKTLKIDTDGSGGSLTDVQIYSNVHVGGAAAGNTADGILLDSYGSIELAHNGGTPFVDFKNDIAGTDFDARIIWDGTNLSINGAPLNVATGLSYKFNGTQVVAARRTGWTVATGTSQRGTFATDTVTLINLARAFKALEEDLIAHGLIG